MKKIPGIIIIASTTLIFAYSCNMAEKKAAKKEAERIEKEIKINDSISVSMEGMINEIDSTVKSVDALLNEL